MNAAPMIAAASAAATAMSLPFVRRALVGRGVLDHANNRSSHQHATPRGGGLGVLLGLAVATALVSVAGVVKFDALVLTVVGATAALAAVGFLDDLRGLPPLPRVAVQLTSGLALGLAAWSGPHIVLVGAAVLATAVAMVFIVNTVNFMDGINGMTALTMSGWGLVAAWAGLIYHVPIAVAVGAAALGTAIGFLPFNVPRASLFLGDVGSYLYGALIGSTSVVMLRGDVPPVVVAAPLVPYAADVVATLIRRALRGESLTEPHREHFYQGLTGSLSLGHALVAVLYGVLAFVCGAVAMLASPTVAIALCMAVGLFVALGPHGVRRVPAGAVSGDDS